MIVKCAAVNIKACIQLSVEKCQNKINSYKKEATNFLIASFL
jgi:hypothetical protein